MQQTVQEKLAEGPMFDNGIVEHHFTPYLRDYDIVVEAVAPSPKGNRFYVEGYYRYRFSHCVVAHVETAVQDKAWRNSWDDVFIDFETWQKAGSPDGYVWGVCYSAVYPGLTYVEGSHLAHEWSERLGKPMHEVFIETNGHNIQLVFHDIKIDKIAQGNPETKEITPIEVKNSSGFLPFR